MKNDSLLMVGGLGVLAYLLLGKQGKQGTTSGGSGGGFLAPIINVLPGGSNVIGGSSAGGMLLDFEAQLSALLSAFGNRTQGIVSEATGALGEAAGKIVSETTGAMSKAAGKVVSEAITGAQQSGQDWFNQMLTAVKGVTANIGGGNNGESKGTAPVIEAAKGILPKVNPSNIIDSARELVGVGARQYGAAFLTGTHVVKPLPGAAVLEKVGPRIVRGIGGRIASRAIPIVGWGLLVSDLGADAARLFGADVPEWLGISPIISAFSTEGNVLERAVANAKGGEKAIIKAEPIDYQLSRQEDGKSEVKGYNDAYYNQQITVTDTQLGPRIIPVAALRTLPPEEIGHDVYREM